MMYFLQAKPWLPTGAKKDRKNVKARKKVAVYNTFFSLYDKLKKVLPEKCLPPKRCCLLRGVAS